MSALIELESADRYLLLAAERGLRGPAGPAGAETVEEIAGADLSGHRLVVLDDAGRAVCADHREPGHGARVFGLTVGAALAGQSVTVRRFGSVVEPSWAWAAGPLWLGEEGALTQTAPSSGDVVQVGYTAGPDRVVIDIKTCVEVEG